MHKHIIETGLKPVSTAVMPVQAEMMNLQGSPR